MDCLDEVNHNMFEHEHGFQDMVRKHEILREFCCKEVESVSGSLAGNTVASANLALQECMTDFTEYEQHKNWRQ